MTFEELQEIRRKQAERRQRIYKAAISGKRNREIALEEKISVSRVGSIVRGEALKK